MSESVEYNEDLNKWTYPYGLNDIPNIEEIVFEQEIITQILREDPKFFPIYEQIANRFNEEEETIKAEIDRVKSSSILDAEWWAEYYNAEDRSLKSRVEDYSNAQSIVPTEAVTDSVDYAVDSGAFDYEMGQLGITKEQLREGMLNISKVESSGGHLAKERQVSATGAQGLFQVLESTARGVLEPNNYFGEKAATAAGSSLEELRGKNRQELQDFLLNNDRGNALFSAAVIMQKLKHNQNKSVGQ